MHRVTTRTSEDTRALIGTTGPNLRATPPGNRRVHDQDDGLRATRDDPQGSRFQTQGPVRPEGDFPDADASYDGYGAYAALDGSRVDNAEFGDLDYTGPLLGAVPRSDAALLDEVHQRLADDPFLRGAGVDVAVDRGEVWLHGAVLRRAHKRLAEDIAYRVAGVLDVHNRLRVSATQAVRPGRSG